MTNKSNQSLTKLAMGGAIAGVGGKIVNLVVSIGSVAILARLLSPIEYGLFGVITICLTLGQLVPQSVSTAMIGQKKIDAEIVASGFTLVFFSGILVACILILLRNNIGSFFLIDLSGPLVFASIILPLASIVTYFDGLLARNFEFKKNAIFDFLSTVLGQTTVSIFLAYLGFGVWALLLGTATGTGIKLGLQLSMGAYQFMRFGPISKDLATHSGWLLLSGFWNYLGRNADNIIVAKILGSESLGIYQRAYNLMMRPVQLVGGVTISVFYPLMASIQTDEQRLRSSYLRGFILVSFLGLPMSLFLFAYGKEVIELLLGPRWSGVINPFRLLALALYFRLGYRISDATLMSIGALRQVNISQFLYAIFVILGAGIGSLWGLTGVATGVAFALVGFFLVSVAYVNSRLKVSVRDFAMTHIAGALVAVVAVVPTLLLRDQVAALAGSFGVLAMGGMALAASYGLVLYFHRSLPLDAISRVTLDDLAQRIEKQLAPLLNKLWR